MIVRRWALRCQSVVLQMRANVREYDGCWPASSVFLASRHLGDAQQSLVLAICSSTTACNGVALSVAVMVAVASVRPVVVAVMGSTVNMAAAMATATTSLGRNHIGHRVTVQCPGSLISTGSESCVGHQRSGDSQVPARGHGVDSNSPRSNVRGQCQSRVHSCDSPASVSPGVHGQCWNVAFLSSSMSGCCLVLRIFQVFQSHVALGCPMVLVLLTALTLVH